MCCLHFILLFYSDLEELSVFTGTGRGLFGGDDRVVYWKCEAGQTLKESILVPITNKVKERALLMAAQQVKKLN